MEGCDVYRRTVFLDGVILINVNTDKSVAAAECRMYLEALVAKWLEVRTEKGLADRLPPGP